MGPRNLLEIEAFVAVAETGSVNRAAIRLNLTQPATTRRIQKFESAMGSTPLFDRTVKPAVLTAFGAHVLEHCRRVLAEVAELETCGNSRENISGVLKAGIAFGLEETLLSSPFDMLRRTFSRIKLEVTSDWSKELMEDVQTGSLDCAIGLLMPDQAGSLHLLQTPIGTERILVVTKAHQHNLGNERSYRLSDLSHQPWLLNPAGCGCRAALLSTFDRLELPIQIAAEVFGEDLQLSLLAQSGGLALAPQRQFENSPYREALEVLDVSDFDLCATISLMRHPVPGRFNTALNLMIEELQSAI